jgi:tetratricopeptide (TPR) repeat protein
MSIDQDDEAAELRLKSWKEIATFLGCDERTAKRWEATRGLPVRRLQLGPRSGVFAYRSEIQQWLRNEKTELARRDAIRDHASAEKAWSQRQGSGKSVPLRNAIGALAVLAIAALAIAAVILSWQELKGSQRSRPPNEEAQSHYRSGLADWRTRTPESLAQAVDQFTQAIVHDPQYAAAYVGLANCYNLLREYSVMPSAYAFPRAKAAAERAVALDPSLADAHASLAFVDFYWSYNSANAVHEFQKAIKLDPNNATTHHWYANVLTMMRDFPRALVEINKAQKLDPGSDAIAADKGLLLFHAGDIEEASILLRQLEQTAPNFSSPHSYLAGIDLADGDDADFLRELSVAAEIAHDVQLRDMANAGARGLAHGGRTGMIQSLIAYQENLFSQGKGDAYILARLYASTGEADKAIIYLRLSIARRETQAVALNVDAEFSLLRKLPAFRRIVRDAGLDASVL